MVCRPAGLKARDTPEAWVPMPENNGPEPWLKQYNENRKNKEDFFYGKIKGLFYKRYQPGCSCEA
ncbi:hypothetical protein, partial [Faecalibaculum rodentium]|uniref:hypothetical protein n=1 Tax=Faecalibaculum rodentium TaxID=1702221 RepID=UPI0026043795